VSTRRYAAKLLFQFRVDLGSDSGKRRICEERIVNFTAKSAQEAYKIAQKMGENAESDYLNDEGNPVYFEFIGIMELLDISSECEESEVWYDIYEKLLSMENKKKLIPPKKGLNVFQKL